MKTMTKKAWSLALALVLALGLVPSMAFAADAAADASYDVGAVGTMTVYLQEGADGTPVKAGTLSADEFEALASEGEYGYVNVKGGVLDVHAMSDIVSLDALFNAVGLSGKWTEGASLSFIEASGGLYGKYAPTYADIAKGANFYPNQSNDDLNNATDPVTVPAGFALTHKQITTAGETAAIGLRAASALPADGEMRFAVGTYVENGEIQAPGFHLATDCAGVILTVPKLTFSVYTQQGDDESTKTLAKEFSMTELKALASSDYYPYAHSNHGSVVIHAATDLVPFTTLFAAAGVQSQWVQGAQLGFVCYDGPYGKLAPLFSDIQKMKWFYPNQSNSEMSNTSGAIEVPCGIALTNLSYDTSGETAAVGFDAAVELMKKGQNDNEVRVLTGGYEAAPGEIYAPGFRLTTGPVSMTIKTYPDVSPSDWYVETGALDYVLSNDHLLGKGVANFRPWDNIDRQDALVTLWRAAGEPSVAGMPVPSYADADMANGYYKDALIWAYNANVATGYAGEGRFGVYEPITRQDLVNMVARYAANVKNVDITQASSAKFNALAGQDAVSDYAVPAMIWATDNDIISGKDGNIQPQENTQRCEMAKILWFTDTATS